MEGKLSDISFAELIGKIYIKNLSGIITLNWDELWKLIYIESGKLQMVVSNQEEENLLEFLINIEAISKEKADEIQQIINSKSILSAIKELGILTEDELNNYYNMLCKGVIFSSFNWVLGKFIFNEIKAIKLDYFLNYSIPEIIFEGTRRISDFQLIKLRIGKYNNLLSLSESFYNEAKNLPLTPSETFIISRIGEKTSIKELIDMTMLEEEEVCRCIFALKCCGFISIMPIEETESPIVERPRRTYEEYRFIETVKEFVKRLPELKDHEILGLEASYDYDSLISSFEELSEKYNPEKYTSNIYSEIKEELNLIYDYILKAYIRLRATSIAKPSISKNIKLSEAEKKHFYAYFQKESNVIVLSEEKDKEIEEYFLSAKEAASTGDYFTAVQNCEKAIAHDKNNPQLYLFLADIYYELPRFLTRAIETYKKYLELKPIDNQARLKLAKLYIKASDNVNALNELLKIIEAEPNNEEAKYLLSQLPS